MGFYSHPKKFINIHCFQYIIHVINEVNGFTPNWELLLLRTEYMPNRE